MRCFFRSMTPTNATPPTAIIDQGEGSGTGAPMVMSFTLALDPKGSTSILSTSPKPGLVRAKMFTLAGTGGGPALPLPPTAVGLKLWVATSDPPRNPSMVTEMLGPFCRLARPMLFRLNCVVVPPTSFTKLALVVLKVWTYCHDEELGGLVPESGKPGKYWLALVPKLVKTSWSVGLAFCAKIVFIAGAVVELVPTLSTVLRAVSVSS